MTRPLAPAALMLAAAGCCFGGDFFSLPLTGPTTTLGPGFTPDPTILNGAAGGPQDASALDPSCRGWLSPAPSHTLSLTGPIPNLRILVHSDADTTLVVRLADGRYLCNDDSDGFDPAIEGSFPAGQHNVFVGTFSQGATASYQLALTTNPALRPSTIGTAPPPTSDTTPIQSGTATVVAVTGNIGGIVPGTICTYNQFLTPPGSPFDCRWRVECNGVVVYGEERTGYTPCGDASWPPGTLAMDTGTTSADGDPTFVFNAGGIVITDDASGPRGAYQITATVATPILPR